MNILITGATSGIGAQLAQDYAAEGHQVIACGRNQERLDELQQRYPENISIEAFDVTDHEQTVATLSKQPPVDIAILSAGLCEYVDINNFDAQLFARVFAVNVQGTVNCVQGLLGSLKQGSKLVTVGSLARLLPFTRAQAYGGSKAAIQYITRSLEVDLKPRGIQVLGVSPGFVKTPMTDANDFEMPMRVSVEFAARKIRQGIAKGQRDIGFPLLFSAMLRAMAILPQSIQVAISRRMKD